MCKLLPQQTAQPPHNIMFCGWIWSMVRSRAIHPVFRPASPPFGPYPKPKPSGDSLPPANGWIVDGPCRSLIGFIKRHMNNDHRLRQWSHNKHVLLMQFFQSTCDLQYIK